MHSWVVSWGLDVESRCNNALFLPLNDCANTSERHHHPGNRGLQLLFAIAGTTNDHEILYKPAQTPWQYFNYAQMGMYSTSPSCLHARVHIDGLIQERRNSTANALELRLSCINQSIHKLDSIRRYYFKICISHIHVCQLCIQCV